MARVKIDYGIDLGTTNSAICRMEKGVPTITKSDVQKDTMPSCVTVNKKGTIRVGEGAYNTLKQDKKAATKSWSKEASNTYMEFKRTMATDTQYLCNNLGRSLTSEELSAEVLKALRSFVTDEDVLNAVITVPAKFTVNQKTATMEAAKMAGFRKCELLQEPIAAAMAYGLSADEKDGLWMVFDFGGGTFDAALLRVEDGIMRVFDTEGDNYLGGKNLDYAIVDAIILPYLSQEYQISSYLADSEKRDVLRDAMKTYAEEAKNQLSFKTHEDILSNLGELGTDEEGVDIELDIRVEQEAVFNVLRPHFQKAVDICKDLLKRNNLKGEQLSKLILVGGPTHSPLIRQMLREQITPNVDTSIDPMTAVAMGASLYASTIDAEVSDADIEVGTVKLNVTFESTSVAMTEWVSCILPDDSALDTVWVELVRADKAWSSGKVEINRTGNVIEASLLEGRANAFSIVAYDAKGSQLPCFPSEISIIQGSKVGAAPLPYNIGIATWNANKKRGVFRMAKGLEKNKPLPAVGVINGLKTSKQLRPGVSEDVLTIPIYQTDDFAEAEGKTASLYEHIGDIRITGDDVDQLLPVDSSVDVTLKVDSSEQMTLELHFLATDLSVERALDTGKKHSIEDAEQEILNGLHEVSESLQQLKSANVDTSALERSLAQVKAENAQSSEKKMVLSHLKELMRKVEALDEASEWDRLEQELRDEFERLESAQHELGDSKTGQLVEELRKETDNVIRTRNVNVGRNVLEKLMELYFELTRLYQLIGFVSYWHQNFASIQWKDRTRARQLIDLGLQMTNDNPTVEKLQPILREIFPLLPDDGSASANAGGLLR